MGVPTSSGAPLRGILIADSFAMLWKAMLIVFTIGVLLLWRGATASEMREGDGPEFFTLLIGATLGKYLFQITHIRSWQGIGFALGTCCHGLGTARSIQVNPDAGAYAALALGMQAVLAALLIPLVFHLFA